MGIIIFITFWEFTSQGLYVADLIMDVCFVSKITSTNVVMCNNVLVIMLNVMVCCCF